MQIQCDDIEKNSKLVLKNHVFNGKHEPDALIVNFQYLASNYSGFTSNILNR